jgi:hypothetical protein
MFLTISIFLTNGLLAKIVVGVLSEPFLLAMFGASFILMGKFVHWLGMRNRAESMRGSSDSEMTKIDGRLAVGVETNSTLLPLGLERPLGFGPAALPSTVQSWLPAKPAADSTVAVR